MRAETMGSLRVKHVVLYLMFVGLPLLVLVWVLHAGRGLEAPASIAGRWRLDSARDVAAGVSCGPAAGGKQGDNPGEVVLQISQSGRHVTLNLGALSLGGKMEGNHIAARTRSAHLEADVDRGSTPPSLTGTVEVATCGAHVPIHATRETGPNGKGAF
jgi:hypothetical protein